MRNTQMQTIFGTPYTPPTPEELQALVRQAHAERAQVLRNAFAAVFGRRSEPEPNPRTSYTLKHVA